MGKINISAYKDIFVGIIFKKSIKILIHINNDFYFKDVVILIVDDFAWKLKKINKLSSFNIF